MFLNGILFTLLATQLMTAGCSEGVKQKVIVIGQTSDITCQQSPDNYQKWTWKHNGVVLTSSKRILISGSILMIKNTTHDDEGVYECCVITDTNSDCRNTSVSIIDRPPAPHDVIVTSASPSTLDLTWSESRLDDVSVIRYVIKGMGQYDKGWSKMATSPEVVTSPPCVVTGLQPNNKYVFKVVAVTQLGRGRWSKKSAAATTQQAGPSKAPTEVKGEEIKPGEVLITWKPILPKYSGSFTIVYEVVVKKITLDQASLLQRSDFKIQTNSSVSCLKKTNFHSSSPNIKIQTNLSIEPVPYMVEIRAQNELGNGPFSKPIIVQTEAADSPSPPHGFKVDWYDAYNAKLSWKESVNENITVLGYKICVCNVIYGCDANLLLNMTTKTNQPNIKISGLEPSHLYMVKFASFTNAGTGPWSSEQWDSMDPGIILFNTAFPPPNLPPMVQHISVSKDRMFATWSPPDFLLTVLEGYYVEIWHMNQTLKNATRYETNVTQIAVDLEPKSEFFMWVRGFNKGGAGTPSDLFTISTITGEIAMYGYSDYEDYNSREGGGGGGCASMNSNLIHVVMSLMSLFWMVDVLR